MLLGSARAAARAHLRPARAPGMAPGRLIDSPRLRRYENDGHPLPAPAVGTA